MRARFVFLLGSTSLIATSIAFVQCGGDDSTNGPPADSGAPDNTTQTDGGGGQDGSTDTSAPDSSADASSEAQGEAGCIIVDAGAPGTVDPTFTSGHVTFPKIGTPFHTKTGVIDSMGRIYVIGGGQGCVGSGFDFAVMRLTPTGSLDTTFGGDAGATGYRCYDFGGNELPSAAVVDSQDRVVIGGNSSANAAVLRITPSGDPDNGFGTNGVALFKFANNAGGTVFGVTSDADGIVVSGSNNDAFGDSTIGFAQRLKSDTGAIDNTFTQYRATGVNGFRAGHWRGTNGNVYLPTNVTATTTWAMVVLSSTGAEILAADGGEPSGTASGRPTGIFLSPPGGGETENYFVVAGSAGSGGIVTRLGADGTVGAGFGTAGKYTVPGLVDFSYNLRPVVRQCNGQGIVMGYAGNPSRPLLVRFAERTGTPDPSYGEAGTLLVPFDGGQAVSNGALIMDPASGKVIIVSGNGANDGPWVTRLLP